MIILQILYFLASAAIMAAIGAFLLIPPLKDGDREMLYARMLASFAAKLLAGVGLLVLAWKGFGWSSTVAAFGMVAAYMVALLIILLQASNAVKALSAGQTSSPSPPEQKGEG